MEQDKSLIRRSGNIMAGLILIVVGVVLLLNQLGYYFPDWLISWPVFLIVLGLFTGVRHQFRNPAWIWPIGVGMVFLLNRIYPDIGILRFVWPAVIIGLGVWLIFGWQYYVRTYKHKFDHWKWQEHQQYVNSYADEDGEFIDVTSVFGGVHKNVFSKHFKGGDITSFMGGAEINLSQADIQGKVMLDVTQIFGGTKLIVPSHWDVKSEMVAVFGSIEDKRAIVNDMVDKEKVLIIQGTSVFGGIEVLSYV